MKIYFIKKYSKMYKPMNVGDSAYVCNQSAEKLIDEGFAVLEWDNKYLKTKKEKKVKNGDK